MIGVELLSRGLLAGLIISAPVGPVNVLCISRTINKGRKSGFVTGLGAAAADTFYGSIAGFSISFVIDFLVRNQGWFRLFGGVLMIVIGIAYWFRKPPQLGAKPEPTRKRSDMASAFVLTAANPSTVLSFLAVLASLGLRHQRSPLLTLVVIGGIFAGSMAWWTLLTLGAGRLRSRCNENTMVWMNRVGGLAIGLFGLVLVLVSGVLAGGVGR